MPRCSTSQARLALARCTVVDSEKWIDVYGYDDLLHDPTLVLTGSRQPAGRCISPGCLDALRRSLAEPEARAIQDCPLH